jgi:hypothetical protein
MDRPSRVPTDQIDPTTMTPYPCPCYSTSPTTQNRSCGGEPPRNLIGGRPQSVPPPPSDRPTPSALPLSLARGPTLTASARTVSPPPRLSGPICPRRHAPALGRNPPPPPGPANREFLSFFFSYFHIYVYMLIFYAPKIVQKFF